MALLIIKKLLFIAKFEKKYNNMIFITSSTYTEIYFWNFNLGKSI